MFFKLETQVKLLFTRMDEGILQKAHLDHFIQNFLISGARREFGPVGGKLSARRIGRC
jgi:hypothetical protein